MLKQTAESLKKTMETRSSRSIRFIKNQQLYLPTKFGVRFGATMNDESDTKIRLSALPTWGVIKHQHYMIC